MKRAFAHAVSSFFTTLFQMTSCQVIRLFVDTLTSGIDLFSVILSAHAIVHLDNVHP